MDIPESPNPAASCSYVPGGAARESAFFAAQASLFPDTLPLHHTGAVGVQHTIQVSIVHYSLRARNSACHLRRYTSYSDDLLGRLASATCFSSLDLASGYWQAPVVEEHRHLTAFMANGEM